MNREQSVKSGALKWYHYLHVLLIPFFFFVHNYIDFYGLVSGKKLLPSLGWAFLSAGVLIALFRLLFRHTSKAVLMTTVLLLAGFFSPLLMQLGEPAGLNRYSLFLPLLLLVVAGTFVFLWRTKKEPYRIHHFLTLCFVVLLVVDLALFIAKGPDQLKKEHELTIVDAPQLKPVSLSADSLPDIYYLIFDAMPSADVAKELLGVDLQPMESSLQQIGFVVQHNVSSAAARTHVSMFSNLNMGYPPFQDQQQISFKELHEAIKGMNKNRLTTFLSAQGYKIVNGGLFPLNNDPGLYKEEDWIVRSPEDMIYNQTLWNRIARDFTWLQQWITGAGVVQRLNERIQKDVAYLKKTDALVRKTAEEPSGQPRFLYAHFNLPHGPYKFHSNGEMIQWKSDEELSKANRQQLTTDQLQYTTNLLPQLCNYILKHSKRKTIIIVQGDHGMRSKAVREKGEEYVFETFSALYVPVQLQQAIPDTLYTPNTFRIVLNEYFHQSLPLLQSRQFHLTYFKEEQIFRDEF